MARADTPTAPMDGDDGDDDGEIRTLDQIRTIERVQEIPVQARRVLLLSPTPAQWLTHGSSGQAV